MCNQTVVVAYRGIADTPIERPCGTTWAGETHLCESCEDTMLKKYPQGWRFYPGDTCVHGVYVGGVGADYMCPQCE